MRFFRVTLMIVALLYLLSVGCVGVGVNATPGSVPQVTTVGLPGGGAACPAGTPPWLCYGGGACPAGTPPWLCYGGGACPAGTPPWLCYGGGACPAGTPPWLCYGGGACPAGTPPWLCYGGGACPAGTPPWLCYGGGASSTSIAAVVKQIHSHTGPPAFRIFKVEDLAGRTWYLPQPPITVTEDPAAPIAVNDTVTIEFTGQGSIIQLP